MPPPRQHVSGAVVKRAYGASAIHPDAATANSAMRQAQVSVEDQRLEFWILVDIFVRLISSCMIEPLT
jgi:hypothetical protein